MAYSIHAPVIQPPPSWRIGATYRAFISVSGQTPSAAECTAHLVWGLSSFIDCYAALNEALQVLPDGQSTRGAATLVRGLQAQPKGCCQPSYVLPGTTAAACSHMSSLDERHNYNARAGVQLDSQNAHRVWYILRGTCTRLPVIIEQQDQGARPVHSNKHFADAASWSTTP